MQKITAVLGLAVSIWAMQGQAALAANCDNATSNVAMTECVQKQYSKADAALNAAYKSAMAVMQATDADLPKAQRGAADALKGAQRAWIAVRDGTCKAEGFLWEGGTGQGLAVLSCLLSETQARTDVLTSLAQGE